MTKRQREQVVELLRCAADIAVTKTWRLWGCGPTAADDLMASERTRTLAELAITRVSSGDDAPDGYAYISAALEAAARVEEGSWP